METLNKKQAISLKQKLVNRVMETVMHIIYESDFYDSSLWPINGFKAGSFPGSKKNGTHKIDTINIKIWASHESDNGSIRFNLWNKTYGRGFKQYKALIILIDQAVCNDILFETSYPSLEKKMIYNCWPDGSIMGMLDFKFTIQ